MARKRVSIRAAKDVLLVNGADLIIYSDNEVTTVFQIDASTGALTLVGASTLTGDIALTGDMTLIGALALTGDVILNGALTLEGRDRFDIFDDFLQQTLVEADTPWILNSGSDAQAIDPAIGAQEGGVVVLTSGDADGVVANDGSQFVCHIPVQADSGGLILECRLHINTAITTVSVNVGLTDITTLEEPFSIATVEEADAITSVATDAVCFVFDSAAVTKEWFACAVDTDVDDTGNAATGSAPVADTYQVLRIEISADGATIKFFVDGVLKTTLSGAAGVTPNVNLYATVIVNATTTTSKTVDVDYIYVGHTR